MIKLRVQGLPDEVAAFADALERAGAVLERSGPYSNRGASRYVRVYMDVECHAMHDVADMTEIQNRASECEMHR